MTREPADRPQGADQEPRSGHSVLSPDDIRVLDHLAEHGFELDRIESLPSEDQPRAWKVAQLLGLLETYPVAAADDTLLHATLAGIDRHEAERAERMSVEAGPSRRWIRMPDFISVAAVVLIFASIAWPTLAHIRQRSIDFNCANNLRQLGLGFAQYARDFDGAVPMQTAGLSWDRLRHTDNLEPLIEGGYCEAGHLDCPGHTHGTGPGRVRTNYSYQWQVPGQRPLLSNGPTVRVLMGDRNPLVDAARNNQVIPEMSISISHGARGQFVLHDDGRTEWLVNPVVGTQDNIWLPHGMHRLERGSGPTLPGDSFLTH